MEVERVPGVTGVALALGAVGKGQREGEGELLRGL